MPQRKDIYIVVALACLAAGAAAPPPTRVVTGDGVIAATVNGVPLRLRVLPGATAMPLLTADFAARAKLKAGMFGAMFVVGPERVVGSTTIGKVDFGDGPAKRRVVWTNPRYLADVDGVVGPGGVPEAVVRFALHPARAGERIVALPLVEQAGIMSSWGERFAQITVDGAPMRVRFDPLAPRSLVTAAGGARLAAAFGGVLAGDTVPVAISFGIERPVRAMHLAVPLAVGPLSVSDLGVRTGDVGSAASIREADADPDEILVTAQRKRDPSADRLTIGADLLARCSFTEFDKPAKIIRLSCV